MVLQDSQAQFHSAKQIANCWILHSAAAAACAKQKKAVSKAINRYHILILSLPLTIVKLRDGMVEHGGTYLCIERYPQFLMLSRLVHVKPHFLANIPRTPSGRPRRIPIWESSPAVAEVAVRDGAWCHWNGPTPAVWIW